MLRQLGKTVHNPPNILCVFICPKLMIPVWERRLFNMADLVVYVPPGATFWPSSMHESFVIGFISPFIPHRPWRIRGTPKVLVLVRTVSFLPRESPGDAGSVMRQILLLLNMTASMSGVLARGLLLS